MGRLTPDEARGLLGAYALGAVDDDELDAVAELVLADAEARAELHTLQLGVAWLDHVSTGAPRHVWRAIADEIAADRTDVDGDRAGPGAPGPAATVVDLAARRRGRHLFAVAAAVAVLLLTALGLLVTRTAGGPPAVAEQAAAARERSGTEVVAMRTAAGDRLGSLVVAADGRGYVVWSDPPQPVGAGRTYQLWALAPDGPRSLGLLGADAADRAVRLGSDATGVAVTVEPRGGSPAPTGDPVAVAVRLGASVRGARAASSVEVRTFRFRPAMREVAPGTTVVWRNRDRIAHTVTGKGDAAAAIDGMLPRAGARYAVRFDAPGTYDYFCARHPSMTGTVVVR